MKVTVLNLLNHTAGLDWRIITDAGDEDDALAGQVAKMAELKLIVSPGTPASYSQERFNLAGRIAEKVTGLTYSGRRLPPVRAATAATRPTRSTTS